MRKAREIVCIDCGKTEWRKPPAKYCWTCAAVLANGYVKANNRERARVRAERKSQSLS